MSHRDSAAGSVTFSPPPRNLVAELAAIAEWLTKHPSVTSNALSQEAGLGRNSLASLLREHDPEKPTETRLDKLYAPLRRYGFAPQGPGLPVALSVEAVAGLLDLHAQGYVLFYTSAVQWRVALLSGEGRLQQVVGTGATPEDAISGALHYLSSKQ